MPILGDRASDRVLMVTLKEAIAVIRDWQSQGLKVGFVACGGYFHDAHRAMFTQAKNYCDKLVCNVSAYESKIGDTAIEPCYIFGKRYLPDMPVWNVKRVEVGALEDINNYVDLAFNSQMSDYDGLTAEDDAFVEKELSNYLSFFKEQYAMDIPLTEYFELSVHLWYSWIDHYLFPIDVRIRSWKDGMWNLRHQVYWKEVMGREYIVLEPVKDGDLIKGSRLEYANSAKLNELVQKMSFTITKDTTLKNIAPVFEGSGMHIADFYNYSGPILKYVGKTSMVCFTVGWPQEKPGSVEVSGYTHVVLFD
jgi:hypothetical protein